MKKFSMNLLKISLLLILGLCILGLCNSVNAAKVEGLEIVEEPDKMTYAVGERFDSTGIVVYAIFDDKSEADVTNNVVYRCTRIFETLGENVVTLCYEEVETELRVNVVEELPVEEPEEPAEEPEEPKEEPGSNVTEAIGGIVSFIQPIIDMIINTILPLLINTVLPMATQAAATMIPVVADIAVKTIPVVITTISTIF